MSPLMSLREVAQAVGAVVSVGDAQTAICRVETDTRKVQPGDLFVALKGQRFDANELLAQAKASGASACICTTQALPLAVQSGLPAVAVADTKLAFGQLARWWRLKLGIPVIAVAGSNGKTTVTQMLAAILREWKGERSLSTQGNLNNDVGVPMTLLALRPGHEIAVVELGMNHPGEIAYLAPLVGPTVALVNNAQREHQEHMQSVEAVARENGQVITALPSHGVAVFPANDAHADVWQQLSQDRQRLVFDATPSWPDTGAQVYCQSAIWASGHWRLQLASPAGELAVRLHAPGWHNVHNALAAVAAALAAGVPGSSIVGGLEAFRPVKGRSLLHTVTRGGRQHLLIDDTYNANPDSVLAAIGVLRQQPGKTLLVLGDMGEVGERGPEFHREVGAQARRQGIDALVTHGRLCAEASRAFGHGRHFETFEELLAHVTQTFAAYDAILVKGSRFMRMERVTQALLGDEPPEEAPCC